MQRAVRGSLQLCAAARACAAERVEQTLSSSVRRVPLVARQLLHDLLGETRTTSKAFWLCAAELVLWLQLALRAMLLRAAASACSVAFGVRMAKSQAASAASSKQVRSCAACLKAPKNLDSRCGRLRAAQLAVAVAVAQRIVRNSSGPPLAWRHPRLLTLCARAEGFVAERTLSWPHCVGDEAVSAAASRVRSSSAGDSGGWQGPAERGYHSEALRGRLRRVLDRASGPPLMAAVVRPRPPRTAAKNACIDIEPQQCASCAKRSDAVAMVVCHSSGHRRHAFDVLARCCARCRP